ncbi:MAG: hypothetical protein N3D15_02190 [Syntrophorhabdaceae bacterium]|nr:hypothetical protein [Syntrophorhabdaceae bacterium]
MADEIFIVLFFLSCLFVQVWAFKNLPHERWQILASLPRKKILDERWSGVNITFYGLFIAIAYTSAISLFFFLLGAIDLNLFVGLLISGSIGLICIPASRIIARIVEKKKHTFTVGGASFTGMIIAPWILLMLTSLNMPFLKIEKPLVVPILSALVIAYALGEGMGRLACISFGCCYGRPVKSCGPIIKRIFTRYAFVFTGKTKKAAYAHGYENERLVPIQALTSLIYVSSSMCGAYLFLKGHYYISFLGIIIMVQLWRVLSEFLRADYRGDAKFTVYQVMSLMGLAYVLMSVLILPEPISNLPDLKKGIIHIWDPFFLLSLNILWWTLFIIFGKSTVTASDINLYVAKENI